MAKLSVHLVAWNGAKYIPYLFQSLRAQTYKDWELLAIDNGSKDDTADLIERELQNLPVPAHFTRNEKNLGFAGGHNQAVRLSGAPPLTLPRQGGENQFPPLPEGRLGGVGVHSEYMQLLNQDIVLAPDYLEKVVAMMDKHPEAGAGQGLLLRWDFNTNMHTEIIDTMGLRVMRSRRVVDWGTGEPPLNLPLAKGEKEGVVEVFGVSGALPMYRRKAIEEVAYDDRMFDEDFFMYKEDVDLAFRLRAAGWRAYVATAARAWHDRTAAGPREISDRATLQNRRTKSAFINYHSYKNHLLVLLKNEHRANLAKDWPWIFWYEFKKFVYLLFTDWGTLKGLREVCKLWKRTMQKRKFIMRHYRVKPEALRKWYA